MVGRATLPQDLHARRARGCSDHNIRQELGLDLNDVASRACGSRDAWATLVKERILDRIRAIERDPNLYGEEPDDSEVADVVEILTMDQLRARVGEEA